MSEIFNIGIDIGGTKTNLSAMDNEGKIVRQSKVNTKDAFNLQDDPAACLFSILKDFSFNCGIDLSEVKCVVIGVPGNVDPVSQVILTCPNLKLLKGVNLSIDLSSRLNMPVFVENDVNLITLGEQYQGAGKGEANFACIFVGTGIGAGLVLDGKLYVGADGAAGDLGHMSIIPNGRLCTCGGRGCLEMYCSGKALAAQATQLLSPDDRDPAESVVVVDDVDDLDWNLASEVFKAASGGNKRASAAIIEAFETLGWGLSQLATILNPRLILLGGGIINAWPGGIELVQKAFVESARFPFRETTKIQMATLKDHASFAGAFWLASQKLKDQPRSRSY